MATYTELFNQLQTCSLYLHIEWDAANAKRERARSDEARKAAQSEADRIQALRKMVNETLRSAEPIVAECRNQQLKAAAE